MNAEVIKGKRAIAYFDILGFKEKVATLSIDDLADSYTKLIHNTENYVYDKSSSRFLHKEICKRFIFSDSLFIIAPDDTEEGFVELFSYAWRMMQIAIAMDFPLRGAITYGDIYVEPSKGIFIGEAIVNAAVWESKQDWIGAIVDESAVDRYQTVFEGNDSLHTIYQVLLPMYSVPLKNGIEEDHVVINWRINIISEHGIKSLFKYVGNNESVKRKINNTLAFAKAVRKSQIVYFNDEMVPERYRRFYVADHDPNQGLPQSNGDEY